MSENEKSTVFELSFVVDGQVSYVEMVEKGKRLSSIPKPTKEFHTFSGWEKIPSRMPARDLRVEGHFVPNNYRLVFRAGDEIISEEDVAYGSPVSVPADPEKEGCRFGGWKDVPETMPGNDTVIEGEYVPNTYQITYTIHDATNTFGDTSFTYPCVFGESIPEMDFPQRPYYSFSGWSEIPETMPAHDVAVEGTLSLTLYKLTRIVDGEVFREEMLPYGAPVSKKPNPEKEGYYFSGFRALPKTMPDHDVEVVSSMYPARYKASFIINEILANSRYIPFGSPVEEIPEDREGFVFTGWIDCPETMPAHDIEVHGRMIPAGEEIPVEEATPAIFEEPAEKPEEVFVAEEQTPIEAEQETIEETAATEEAPELIEEAAKEEEIEQPAEEEPQYTITFICCGDEVASLQLPEGAVIEAPEISRPVEDILYDSWADLPEKMPAENVTVYAVGHHCGGTVTFLTEGDVYATVRAVTGFPIRLPAEPKLPGLRFVEWKDLPEVMGEESISLEAVFEPETFTVTYRVKGATYATESYAYGTPIVPPKAPTVKKRAFVTWSNLPETMPAEDITTDGLYVTQNTFLLSFRINGQPYAESVLEPGTRILMPTPPQKDGFVFSGWDKNVTVIGREPIIVNGTYTPLVRRLTYYLEDAEYASYEVNVGDPLPIPDAPEAEGFNGWGTLPRLMPNVDLDVHAMIGTVVTVTFIADGAIYAELSLHQGAHVDLPEDPSKEGFTFEGWDNVPETAEADSICTAKFKPNTYYVTFVANGETVSTAETVFGHHIEAPDAPAVEGYTFGGWAGIPEVMPAEDLTVTAEYKPALYTVTFTVNGEVYVTKAVAYGDPIELPAEPAVEGMNFNGWGEIPASMPAENLTLTAEYKPALYTVTFTVNGEVYVTETVAYGDPIELPAEPAVEGMNFDGWGEIPASMPAQELTFAALLSEIPAVIEVVAEEKTEEQEPEADEQEEQIPVLYTVLFRVNDEDYASYQLLPGEEIPLPEEPDVDGFDGWAEHPLQMPEDNITVEAVIKEPVPMPIFHSLTYLVGDEAYASYNVAVGEALPVPDDPANVEGFVGWGSIPAEMPDEDLTLVADIQVPVIVEEPQPTLVTLTFKVGDDVYATYSAAAGAEIELPEEPVVENAIFNGWKDLPETMPEEDATVTADISYQMDLVRFMVGDEIIHEMRIAPGTKIEPPAAPEREGYDFSGWGDTPVRDGEGVLIINGTYLPHKHTVRFFVGKKIISTLELPFGAAIPLPEDPVKEKYTFFGWSDLPETMPDNDLKLQAVFECLFTVTYEIDGEVFHKDTLPPKSRITPPEVPVKEGYTFTGWSEYPPRVKHEPVLVSGSYVPNEHKVTFADDEEVFATVVVKFGEPIELINAPVKEGRMFIDWGEVPETMPDSDITLEARYEMLKNKLVFVLDGSAVAEMEVECGSPIQAPHIQEKVGYTFGGWENMPETMPGYPLVISGSYKIDTHKVSYMNGDILFAEQFYEYGAPIIEPVEEPLSKKKKLQFYHWDQTLTTMGTEDIIVNAVFADARTLKKLMRSVTFMVDDDVYRKLNVLPGHLINVPQEPSKRGLKFVGWDNLPERMPEQDVLARAKYEPIVSTVTFMLDGEVYYTISLGVGERVPSPIPPEKDGMIFECWENYASVMPAYDFVVTACYTKRKYTVVYTIGDKKITEEYPWGESIPAKYLPNERDRVFEGWEGLPAIMPMHDVLDVVARYHYRDFKITYVIDGVPVTYSMVTCNSVIIPPSVAPRGKRSIIRWINMPANNIMPANDVIVEAVWGTEREARKARRKADDDPSRSFGKATPETKPDDANSGASYAKKKMRRLMR